MNIFEAGRRATKVAIVLIFAWAACFAFALGDGQWWGALGIGAGFAVAMYAFAWATGWVMRGLLGIPNGKDFKQ